MENEIVYPLDSFVFYRSFRDAIEEMDNDTDKLVTVLAICDYALYGVEPHLESAMPRMAFTMAKPNIDANYRNRKNGKMGGRPPKEKPMVSKNKNPRFSKTKTNEDENKDENVDETESGADKPPTRAHGEYGWVKLTDEQYSKLIADFGEAEVTRAIAYVDESAQQTGNKNKWKDWNLVIRKCIRDGWGLPKGYSSFGPEPESRMELVTNDDGTQTWRMKQ